MKRGKDSKFFTTTKKGEIHELKNELKEKGKQVDAVKKVIAAMTVGKDVSSLFSDMNNCAQTDNLELKKLAYLYIMNYAKTKPKLAILAVNTFKKDAIHPNALIRALAIRTMGCIRLDSVSEHLAEMLSPALKDKDPYVRKTAAICVAKLYDMNPDLVDVQGYLDSLQELISDSNPIVVANAVAALNEIQVTSGQEILEVNTSTLKKLLAALNECTEWGQVFILDALAKYTPVDSREAESIIERVAPRLKHANSAVVLSAIKIILRYLSILDDSDRSKAFCRKMAPPLVSLLSGGASAFPEIQYVALRNINLIVQKRPEMLVKEIKVFFCKYDDPIYVKLEKLEVIIMLACDRNIEQVLLEFKEYAREVDVEFVRKSVRAIGRCAVKLEKAAERCINVLLELIQTKVNYVVQEAIVVIKDIFRKYPNRYESIIGTLCENLVSLDEPEAKASMIWIIGEYAKRIDNADDLLDSFLEGFEDEPASVQLQLLTAVVKLYLEKPKNNKGLVQRALELATEKSDNPDLRDRGYVYWRLLSSSQKAAKAVVLAKKPTISDDTYTLAPALLEQLIAEISTLSSIYHKPPEAFVPQKLQPDDEEEEDEDELDEEETAETNTNADPFGLGLASEPTQAPAPATTPAPAPTPNTSEDLLGDLFGSTTPTPAPVSVSQGPDLPTLLAPDAKNIGFYGQIENDGKVLRLQILNKTDTPLQKFAIQLKKNPFGINAASKLLPVAELIQPGQFGESKLPLQVVVGGEKASDKELTSIQAAVKNMETGIVCFFSVPLSTNNISLIDVPMTKKSFIESWKKLPSEAERTEKFVNLMTQDLESIPSMLSSRRIYFVAKRSPNDTQVLYYFYSFLFDQTPVLIELTFKPGVDACQCCIKTDKQVVSPLFLATIKSAIAH